MYKTYRFWQAAITIIGLLMSARSQAQLTGPWRNDFIKGSAETCYKTQRAAPVNKSMSDINLKKYCTCSMTYIADLLNNQLATDIEKGYQKMSPTWNQMASQYCQKNFEKY